MDPYSHLRIHTSVFTPPSQLRRDHINQEHQWILRTLGASRTKLVQSEAHAVDAQWAFYRDEQRRGWSLDVFAKVADALAL